MYPSLIEIGSKTAEKNSAQTNTQTNKQTDTTKIMVTWLWTNMLIVFQFLGHRLRWPSRLELRCLSVCTSTKSFSDFHLIWYVGRTRPRMRTRVTSTWSKVRVKVTELSKLQKLHFSTSISSAVLAWSSKLMVDGDSMGPGLQLFGAWFLNFLLEKLSWEFKLRCRYFTKFKWLYFGSAWCYCNTGMLLVVHILYMLIWPWPDPRSRSRSQSIWTSDSCP